MTDEAMGETKPNKDVHINTESFLDRGHVLGSDGFSDMFPFSSRTDPAGRVPDISSVTSPFSGSRLALGLGGMSRAFEDTPKR